MRKTSYPQYSNKIKARDQSASTPSSKTPTAVPFLAETKRQNTDDGARSSGNAVNHSRGTSRGSKYSTVERSKAFQKTNTPFSPLTKSSLSELSEARDTKPIPLTKTPAAETENHIGECSSSYLLQHHERIIKG